MSGIGEEQMPLEADDLDQAAAAWFHRLNAASGDAAAAAKQSFRRWFDANSEHAEAFARTCAIWEAVGEHAAAPEMVTLRQAALADARTAAQNRWRPVHLPPARRWPHAIAVSLAAMLALGVGGYFFLRPPPQVYATEIGERQRVTLADNSRVDIDADSVVSVDFTPDRRLVHVVRGQAFFAVEKDPARPFIVESNGRRVIATGTAFNVEELDHGLRVTLVEGHVVVRQGADSTSNSLAELSPGDQLTAETGVPTRIVHDVDILPATAWRQGKLLFANEPLAAAVARMMRYSHFELVVDPSAANLRISGVFDAGDVAALVDAVKTYYRVEAVSDRPNELRLVRRRYTSGRKL
jgi:transmembrane sensor